MSSSAKDNKPRLAVREMVVFAMLGALMFLSRLLMQLLPNIHLVGVLTAAYAVAFRKKALIPLAVYVVLEGIFSGFSLWWIPYIYIWTVLWGAVMLLPKRMSKRAQYIVYPIVCALHGLLFGTLYAPVQALLFGLNFRQMLAWIAAGLPFDVIHAVSNLIAGALIVPLSRLLVRLASSHRMPE